MRQCLVELQETKAHDLDEVLIHFVKIQYLSERVAVLKSPQLKKADPGSDRMSLEGSEQEKESPERGAALAGCQAYLDRLVRELPGGLRDHGEFASPARQTSGIRNEANSNSHDDHTTQHGCATVIRASRGRGVTLPRGRAIVKLSSPTRLRHPDHRYTLANRLCLGQGLVPVMDLERTCLEVPYPTVPRRPSITLRLAGRS